MKVTVLQKDLARVLSYTSRFVSVRAQLPILANIKLSVKGTKLTVQATNLEMSCSAAIGAQVEGDGEVAVPSRVLVDLILTLRSEKITLSSDDESLSVEGEGFKGKLSGLNTSDFPDIPSTVKDGISLPKTSFLDAIERTVFSCSSEPGRPALSGVLLIFKDNTLSLVASDGFRLSRKVMEVESKIDTKIILPKNILVELVRISADAKKVSIKISETEKQVLFALDDTVLSSRLVEGEYPPFEKIIPRASSISVSLDKSEFHSVVKTAAVFARDGANIVALHVEEDSLKISAESARSGSQESSVAAKIDGPAIDIPYNYRFIEDFLNVVKGESVLLKFNNTTSPGVFLDASDESYLHLIMPVKS